MTIIKRFSTEEGGNVATIFCLSAVILCGLIGGAVDFGRAQHSKLQLQAAADSAVLAGATAGSKAADDVRISVATNYFIANYPGEPTPEVSVSGDKVTLAAKIKVPAHFLGVIGINEIKVPVIATAVVGAGGLAGAGPCILLLNNSDIGLYVNSDSKLVAACGLHVNSNHATEALFANSMAQITTTNTCVRGAARLNGGSTATPTPVEGCPVKADPLLALAAPTNAAASCDYTDFKVQIGQSLAMYPGVYCRTTEINSGGRVTMAPGIYIFREGQFVVNSNSQVTGSEVMMFFAGKDASLTVNSDSILNVSAPRTGIYQGMLMFQGRHADNISAPPFIINADSQTRLEGTIYLPKGTLELNSLSTANQAASYTAIVADKMVLNSFGTLTVNADYQAGTPLPPVLDRAINGPSARLTR